MIELPSPTGGTVAYYADSTGLRPGRWLLGREGSVDSEVLAKVLAGEELLCETFDRALGVSRFLLDAAPAWLGE